MDDDHSFDAMYGHVGLSDSCTEGAYLRSRQEPLPARWQTLCHQGR